MPGSLRQRSFGHSQPESAAERALRARPGAGHGGRWCRALHMVCLQHLGPGVGIASACAVDRSCEAVSGVHRSGMPRRIGGGRHGQARGAVRCRASVAWAMQHAREAPRSGHPLRAESRSERVDDHDAEQFPGTTTVEAEHRAACEAEPAGDREARPSPTTPTTTADARRPHRCNAASRRRPKRIRSSEASIAAMPQAATSRDRPAPGPQSRSVDP